MKMATLPLLLCVVMFLSGVSEGWSWFCPRGWSSFSGRCFKYTPTPLTWALAERNCLSKRGNLVSVRSVVEYRAIQRFIVRVSHRSGSTWIGGSDAAQERVWLWSDGKPMKFTNWCPHEPNNVGRNEHCLEMNHAGTKCWNDLPCGRRLPSVCSKRRSFWHRFRG